MNAYEEIDNPEGKAEARELAMLAAQVVILAGPAAMSFEEALPVAWQHFSLAASFVAEQAPPTLDALNPNTLPAPGPNSQVVFNGTGFNQNTVINWNGGDEVTEFVNEGELRTVVKPSLVQAPLPFTLPVYVRNGELKSNVLEFTFTEAPARNRHDKVKLS